MSWQVYEYLSQGDEQNRMAGWRRQRLTLTGIGRHWRYAEDDIGEERLCKENVGGYEIHSTRFLKFLEACLIVDHHVETDYHERVGLVWWMAPNNLFLNYGAWYLQVK